MSNRNYPPYDTILYGGFGKTNIIPVTRAPKQVVRVSDNEVYAIYADIDDENILYKQVWTAEGTGSVRSNPQQKIYKSVDSGNTWSLMYNG